MPSRHEPPTELIFAAGILPSAPDQKLQDDRLRHRSRCPVTKIDFFWASKGGDAANLSGLRLARAW